jgi:hypothetical protein
VKSEGRKDSGCVPSFPSLIHTRPLTDRSHLFAKAAVESPDLLLSPTAQLYARWDGITAHNDAYKKSIWGPVMAGPTGDSIRALLAKAPKLVGNSLLADPLLDGK